jgi:hypothetical protein
MSTEIYNPSHLNGCPAQNSWVESSGCICSQILAHRRTAPPIHGWVCICEITDRDERIWNKACPKHQRP